MLLPKAIQVLFVVTGPTQQYVDGRRTMIYFIFGLGMLFVVLCFLLPVVVTVALVMRGAIHRSRISLWGGRMHAKVSQDGWGEAL
jgi:uncharacterized membrane protein